MVSRVRMLLCTVVLCTVPYVVAAQVSIGGDRQRPVLMVDGKPFRIKGVGGDSSMQRLRDLGGNSVRTWDAEGEAAHLQQANALGLKICLGIWLGQPRQGFRYDDPAQVAKQRDRVRGLVKQFKDSPAVLVWGLGNEMEGSGDDPNIWRAINDLARMVKQIDPNHPTMTVVAEIGGAKVENFNKYCPDVDILGINSYAGGASVSRRYREAGGVKPYIVTEMGTPGFWEVAKTAWGAPIEPTSTAKAERYLATYRACESDALCLGSYAFLWGHKQEATATWFGLLLPDGSKVGAVDALSEAWTGKPVADPCPKIESLAFSGPDAVLPGATLRASLSCDDPGGHPLTVTWSVQPEQPARGGGDAESVPPDLQGAVTSSSATSADVTAPVKTGSYRLFATIRNNRGGAAVANLPFHVRTRSGPVAALPAIVYGGSSSAAALWAPTGWMGNTAAIKVDPVWKDNPHSGTACLRCEYTAADGWGGVAWQSPAQDWGDQAGGWNLAGAKRLAFWARGEHGGEVVSFEYGILGGDKKYPDSSHGKLADIVLTANWKRYEIPVANQDLGDIKTGFVWTVKGGSFVPITFYLDDIQWE